MAVLSVVTVLFLGTAAQQTEVIGAQGHLPTLENDESGMVQLNVKACAGSPCENPSTTTAQTTQSPNSTVPQCTGAIPGPCLNPCPFKNITKINGQVMDDVARMTRYVPVTGTSGGMVFGRWANLSQFTNGPAMDNSTITVNTYFGIREAGTRMAIHMHEKGGQTCVLSGASATIFVEGMEPQVYPPGTCYNMPPGVYMTSANLGDQDMIEVDILTGKPDTTVCEPGWDNVCVGRDCWENPGTHTTANPELSPFDS